MQSYLPSDRQLRDDVNILASILDEIITFGDIGITGETRRKLTHAMNELVNRGAGNLRPDDTPGIRAAHEAYANYLEHGASEGEDNADDTPGIRAGED